MTTTIAHPDLPAAPASEPPRARVLLVDDEPALLSSMRRQLSGRFQIETEVDPLAALERLDDLADLAVVVSDMRMPGMNGAVFLNRVHQRRPDVTRMLLTGFAEVDYAIAAINQGRIFRFLSKPVAPDEMRTCLDDAVRQFQLIRAERELLEQTLRGSVRALVDTLSMANPTAFARATRIGRRLLALARYVDAPDQWQIEVAGTLSYIGTVVLPPGVNDRLQAGDELTPRQQQYVDELPEVAVSLLEHIPRLETVCRIITFQRQRYDGRGPVTADTGGDDIPLGARLLRVATDYDTLEARGRPVDRALAIMRGRDGVYDPALLDALAAVLEGDEGRTIAYLPLRRLRGGMVLAKDLCTDSGMLLVGRGQELSPRTILRVRTWAAHTSVDEPVAVYVGPPDDPAGG